MAQAQGLLAVAGGHPEDGRVPVGQGKTLIEIGVTLTCFASISPLTPDCCRTPDLAAARGHSCPGHPAPARFHRGDADRPPERIGRRHQDHAIGNLAFRRQTQAHHYHQVGAAPVVSANPGLTARHRK